MKRLLYESYRRFYVAQVWILRRFTRAGLLLICCLISSAVVGLDTHRTMAYQAFTFLLSLGLLSIIPSLFFRPGLEAKRTLPKFVTAGVPFSYTIIIQNKKNRPEKGLFIFENTEDPRPDYQTFKNTREPGEDTRNPVDRYLAFYRWMWLMGQKRNFSKKGHRSMDKIPVIPPGGTAEITMKITPLRRGRLRFTGVTVARPDPLGLFNSFVKIDLPDSAMVLPTRHPIGEVSLSGGRRHQAGGVSLASSVGESGEFVSLRDYRPGDPMRKIHWKSWAKTGRPLVKEQREEFFVRHALVLDTFQEGPAPGRLFEEAVSVAASFAADIITQESLLDLLFVGTKAFCFTSGRGLGHTEKTLAILASVSPCVDKPFGALIPLVMERASLLSGCICVFLKWDGQRKELVAKLSGMGTPVMVLVIGEDEKEALDPGPLADFPEHLHKLIPGKIREGLARL